MFKQQDALSEKMWIQNQIRSNELTDDSKYSTNICGYDMEWSKCKKLTRLS
jgi:hypothetical protein